MQNRRLYGKFSFLNESYKLALIKTHISNGYCGYTCRNMPLGLDGDNLTYTNINGETKIIDSYDLKYISANGNPLDTYIHIYIDNKFYKIRKYRGKYDGLHISKYVKNLKDVNNLIVIYTNISVKIFDEIDVPLMFKYLHKLDEN